MNKRVYNYVTLAYTICKEPPTQLNITNHVEPDIESYTVLLMHTYTSNLTYYTLAIECTMHGQYVETSNFLDLPKYYADLYVRTACLEHRRG